MILDEPPSFFPPLKGLSSSDGGPTRDVSGGGLGTTAGPLIGGPGVVEAAGVSEAAATSATSATLGRLQAWSYPLGVSVPFPIPERCGHFDLAIGRDGTWYYRKSPIGRQPLCRLFARVLHRDFVGRYWLITPAECGLIEVELAPFTISDMAVRAGNAGKAGEILLTTNLGETFPLDRAHPLRLARVGAATPPGMTERAPATSSPAERLPLVRVRGRLEALLTRAVYYRLIETGFEKNGKFYIPSGGDLFCLGMLDDLLRSRLFFIRLRFMVFLKWFGPFLVLLGACLLWFWVVQARGAPAYRAVRSFGDGGSPWAHCLSGARAFSGGIALVRLRLDRLGPPQLRWLFSRFDPHELFLVGGSVRGRSFGPVSLGSIRRALRLETRL